MLLSPKPFPPFVCQLKLEYLIIRPGTSKLHHIFRPLFCILHLWDPGTVQGFDDTHRCILTDGACLLAGLRTSRNLLLVKLCFLKDQVSTAFNLLVPFLLHILVQSMLISMLWIWILGLCPVFLSTYLKNGLAYV